MNAADQRRYAAKLEASGVHFTEALTDGSGNRIGLRCVPWTTVLAGWLRDHPGHGITDRWDEPSDAKVFPIRRDG